MTKAEHELRQAQEEYRQAFRAYRAAWWQHSPTTEAALVRVRAAVQRHDECHAAYRRQVARGMEEVRA